MPVAVDTSP